MARTACSARSAKSHHRRLLDRRAAIDDQDRRRCGGEGRPLRRHALDPYAEGGRSRQARRMTGGDKAMLDKIRPVLECYADVIVHARPVGAAHTLKLINNFIGLGNVAAPPKQSLPHSAAGCDGSTSRRRDRRRGALLDVRADHEGAARKL